MGKNRNKIRSHLYDLGSYQFNADDDVDLLNFEQTSLERFEENYLLRITTNSTNFKMRSNSIVPQAYEPPTPKLVNYPQIYVTPSETTRSFMEGLKTTVGKVNEKLRLLSDSPGFEIGTQGFGVIEYAKILTDNESCTLYFPVDVKKKVKISEEEFEISINFDNPTSLDIHNQPNGCQGSHFGYTIITKSSGSRTRGHILINTFVGFPSRNEREKAKVMKGFKERTENSRALNFNALCNSALGFTKVLPFDITTSKGVHSSFMSYGLYYSDRTKKLPFQLKALHRTFPLVRFNLPDLKDSKLFPLFIKWKK